MVGPVIAPGAPRPQWMVDGDFELRALRELLPKLTGPTRIKAADVEVEITLPQG